MMAIATKAKAKSEKPVHAAAPTHPKSHPKSPSISSSSVGFALQHSVGNLAVQRLLRAGVIRAKLTISQPHDPDEVEADQMADRVMRMPDAAARQSCPACTTGSTPCPTCFEGQSSTIHREAISSANGQSPAAHHAMRRLGPGHPLDISTRAFFEPRFGSDLSHIRVHTDQQAGESARLIQAKAFTSGSDIAFATGTYAPESYDGRRLLAHELAHVAQQYNGKTLDVQRYVDGDVRRMSITAAWANALTNEELIEQIRIVRSQIAELDTDPTIRDTASANLRILEQEQLERTGASLGLGIANDAPSVPRPSGLPLDSGYSLTPVTVPPDFLNILPEGELVTAEDINHASGATGPSSEGSGVTWIPVSPVLQGMELGGASSGAALLNSSRALASSGFAAAGENAIGLVMFPRVGSPGHGFPQSRLLWGHTAMYTRIGGRISLLRSYGPTSLLSVLRTGMSAVEAGESGVPASIFHGGYAPGEGIPMWTHTGARSIEYPVARALAEAAAEGLPDVGPGRGGGLNGLYTGSGAARNLACGANCVVWAVPEAEAALRGGIGPLTAEGAATSASAIGPGSAAGTAPNVGSQGRLYGMLGEVLPGPGETAQTLMGFDNRTGARVVATIIRDAEGNIVRTVVHALPEAATGAPVVGEMSRGMRYLRWGGRVFFVVGLLTIPAEIALAEEGTRTRTAVGAVSGFAGGMAAGAALGLFCGPGAPVCMVVTGLIGGIAGGFLVRRSAEAIYDVATAESPSRPMSPAESARFSADLERFGSVCPNCHRSSAPATSRAVDSPFGMSVGGVLMPGPREVTLSDDDMAILRNWLERSPGR